MGTQAEVRSVLSWLGAVFGVACLLCLALTFAFTPEAIAAGDHLTAAGLPVQQCPGCAFCGLSRAFALFSTGHFAEGIALNSTALVLYPSFWLVGFGGPLYALTNLVRSRL